MSFLEARFEAQKITFGPLIFQAARLLRELGILETLRGARSGLTLDEIGERVDSSRYGLAAGLVRLRGDRYLLTKTGSCILLDDLTRINMDFVHHDCFQAMYYLEDSIRQGKPAGLRKIFGEWDTIYPALPNFPESARDSSFSNVPLETSWT